MSSLTRFNFALNTVTSSVGSLERSTSLFSPGPDCIIQVRSKYISQNNRLNTDLSDLPKEVACKVVFDSFRLKSSDELFEFIVERDEAFDYLRVRFSVWAGGTLPLPSEACRCSNLPRIIPGFDPIQRIFASERVAREAWRRNENIYCEGDPERVFVDDYARRPLRWSSKKLNVCINFARLTIRTGRICTVDAR